MAKEECIPLGGMTEGRDVTLHFMIAAPSKAPASSTEEGKLQSNISSLLLLLLAHVVVVELMVVVRERL